LAAAEAAPGYLWLNMPNNAELFVQHLQSVFGTEDAIQKADANDGGPPIAVFVYRNLPEDGMIAGVTFGLSHCPFPAWTYSRPEMIVSVQSHDIGWPCAAATIAAMLRGEKGFQYGDVFTTDCTLADDSQMDGFLVFAQSILPEESVSVQLRDYKIHFSQFYPIYSEELATYERIGLQAFWNRPGFDRYDVGRAPIEA
jgi:hypothetical protein